MIHRLVKQNRVICLDSGCKSAELYLLCLSSSPRMCMSSSDPKALGASAACACGLGSILSGDKPKSPHITLRVHNLVSDPAVKAMLSQSLVLPGDDSDSDDVPPPFLQHGVPFEADDADIGRADGGWLSSIRTCAWVRLFSAASIRCTVITRFRCSYFHSYD